MGNTAVPGVGNDYKGQDELLAREQEILSVKQRAAEVAETLSGITRENSDTPKDPLDGQNIPAATEPNIFAAVASSLGFAREDGPKRYSTEADNKPDGKLTQSEIDDLAQKNNFFSGNSLDAMNKRGLVAQGGGDADVLGGDVNAQNAQEAAYNGAYDNSSDNNFYLNILLEDDPYLADDWNNYSYEINDYRQRFEDAERAADESLAYIQNDLQESAARIEQQLQEMSALEKQIKETSDPNERAKLEAKYSEAKAKFDKADADYTSQFNSYQEVNGKLHEARDQRDAAREKMRELKEALNKPGITDEEKAKIREQMKEERHKLHEARQSIKDLHETANSMRDSSFAARSEQQINYKTLGENALTPKKPAAMEMAAAGLASAGATGATNTETQFNIPPAGMFTLALAGGALVLKNAEGTFPLNDMTPTDRAQVLGALQEEINNGKGVSTTEIAAALSAAGVSNVNVSVQTPALDPVMEQQRLDTLRREEERLRIEAEQKSAIEYIQGAANGNISYEQAEKLRYILGDEYANKLMEENNVQAPKGIFAEMGMGFLTQPSVTRNFLFAGMAVMAGREIYAGVSEDSNFGIMGGNYSSFADNEFNYYNDPKMIEPSYNQPASFAALTGTLAGLFGFGGPAPAQQQAGGPSPAELAYQQRLDWERQQALMTKMGDFSGGPKYSDGNV